MRFVNLIAPPNSTHMKCSRHVKIDGSLRHLTRNYSIDDYAELIVSLYRKKNHFGLAYIKEVILLYQFPAQNPLTNSSPKNAVADSLLRPQSRYPHIFIISSPSNLSRGRSLGGLVLLALSAIRRLGRLQLNVVSSGTRGVVVGRRRVVAVVVVWLLVLLLLAVRLLVGLPLLLLLAVVRLRVVCRLAVAWWRPAQRPGGAAVRLVSPLSTAAGGDAS